MEAIPWWVPVVTMVVGALLTGGFAIAGFHTGARALAKLIPGDTLEPILAKGLEQFASELKEAVGQSPTQPPPPSA